ncbi:hypothetical protein A1O1_03660 [Capronia coronata CBS 617.96]|uniref:Uncharacterized protein n=1 Tax=Capronia coronata CBS 617.96 TaxID=1182541 RepID=W9YCE8_9EURO|nr:uncharacterized protein A1O1_03660 [Capronia coronata CBS 617.96]EXJ90557.1 hypothetical protein A1O1_03660 [Capronia coronata CBS 617.96]
MAGGVILTAMALVSSSAVVYTIYLHQTLSRKISHRSGIGLPTADDDSETKIASLPPDLDDPSKYHVIHDIASKRVPSAKLPTFTDPNLLLTKYLRRNMTCFFQDPNGVAVTARLQKPSSEEDI